MTNTQEIKDKILSTIDSLEDLPSFPTAITRLNEKIADPKAGIADFTRIIEFDIELTAHILKLANSPYYASLGGSISSIRQAMVRIGIREIQNVCMAFGAINMFPKSSKLAPAKKFWQHSISCALLSKEIAAQHGLPVEDRELAFTAGLFHDIGIMLLDIYFSDIFAKVIKEAIDSHRSTQVIEIELLGITHASLAARVFKRWEFSDSLINIVENHHTPEICPSADKTICEVVHIADFIVASQGVFEVSVHILPDRSSEEAWVNLGLEVTDTPKLLELVNAELLRAENFIGI